MFLNQARAAEEILFARRYVCVSVCLSAPEGINKQWRDIGPVWLIKQVSGYCRR